MIDYSEAAIEPAEKAIDGAIASGAAEGGAETRLLSLYNMYPQRAQADYVLKAAMLALMKLPETDFNACLPLIPDALLAKEPLSILTEADTLLENAEFERFWDFVKPHAALLEGAVPHFFGAIRRYVVSVVALTHRSLPRDVLARFLGLDAAAKMVDELLAAAKATTEGADVHFPEPVIVGKQSTYAPADLASHEQYTKIMNALGHK